ncbi:unnamed protein product [Paramecium pentaurelia]|uniref:Uncharacterized protein n=1 Tax=Paramecium pentaurelia TaxID=43138 RepID=A0A8S1ULX1_9CILI|nr:unnamed protein product [Paramecium pentaurelia]
MLLFKIIEYLARKTSLLILLQYLSCVVQAQQQHLIDQNFFGDFSTAENWYRRNTALSPTTSCGSSILFGGYQNFDNNQFIAKTFELPPHYQVAIKFSFWRIDQWDDHDHFSIYQDNVQIHNDQYSNHDSSTNLCGNSLQSDFVHQIEKVFDHSSTTVQILMTSTDGGWWGISEFTLYVASCPSGCNSCNKFGCLSQILQIKSFTRRILGVIPDQEGWLYDDTITTLRNQCSDFYYLTSPGDHLSKSIELDNHIAISLQFKVITFNTISSKFRIFIDDNLIVNSQIDQQVYTNVNFCSQTIISQINVFQLEHTNNLIKIDIIVEFLGIPFTNQNQKFGIRDFQLFLKPSRLFDFCTDQNLYRFDGCYPQLYAFVEGCNNYIKGICVECQDGWEYVNQINSCIPKCGDLKITQFEECDDDNNIPFDGCHECKFSCPLDCLVCQFGKCLTCKFPKDLINNKCLNLTINFGEIKLDEDSINYFTSVLEQEQYINLIKHFSQNGKNTFILNPLKIENCLQQLYNYCVKCDIHYQISFNKKYCTPLCNDGITVQTEICDDQNNQQFDGCYKCEKSCQLECQICVGTKCQVCQEGWELLDGHCYQICGDNKLAQLSIEQCDDGNFQPNDGCYECKFQCDQYCYSCVTTDVCYLCQNYFENINGRCRPICGDGHVVIGLEECEDQNQEQFDGCYQCQFQCHEKCEKCYQGKCILCLEGYILLNGQTQQTKNSCGDQITQLEEECDDGNQLNYDGCSDKCQIEENWHCTQKVPNRCYSYTSFLLSFLNQTYDKQYIQMSFTQRVRWNGSFSNFSEAIQIEIIGLDKFQYSILIIPVISIVEQTLKYPIYEFEIQFLKPQIDQPILEVLIQDGIIDEYEQTLQTNTQSLPIQIAKILSLSELNTANKFQQLGNYMMIGLGCSSGLMLLFGDPAQSLEIFDTLQFQSYLRFINVRFPQNLQIYFVSSDFVTISPVLVKLNIMDFFDQTIGQHHVDSIGKLSEYKLNADLLTNIYSQMTQSLIFATLYIFLLFYQQFFMKFCYTNKHFYYIRLSNSKIVEFLTIKIYLLNKKILNLINLYTKKGFIQLFYANSWDLIFKVFMYLVSHDRSGYRTFISYFICILYIGLVIFLLISHFRQQDKRLLLVNEIKAYQYDGVVLFKKFSFILILVGLQTNSSYQCLLLTFILFFYIGVIYVFGFVNSNLDLFIIIWMEFPVMIFTLLSLIYCQDFYRFLNQDQQTILAFVQISVLILGLLGPLIKTGIQFYQKIKQYNLERQILHQVNLPTFNNMIIITKK